MNPSHFVFGILVILIIIPVSIEAQVATQQITVTSDKSVYDNNSIILISGHVEGFYSGEQVSLRIHNPHGNTVWANQVTYDENGDYSAKVNTANPLFSQSGQYTVLAQRGVTQSTNSATFQITTTGSSSIISNTSPTDQVANDSAPLSANDTVDANNFDLETQYLGNGTDLLDVGQYQDALKFFDKALVLDPQDPEVYLDKGKAFNDMGNYSEAIKNYDTGLGINPNDPDILRSKGLTLENLGNHTGALSYYDKVLSADPQDTNALYYEGLTLKNMTQNEQAISSFDKVLALEPTNTDAMYQKGLTLENMGNHTGAIYYYNKILANDPTNIDVLNSKNLAQGTTAINHAGGASLDQQLIIVVVGLFLVIAIIIILIDRSKNKRHKVTLSPELEQGTIWEPSPVGHQEKEDDDLRQKEYGKTIQRDQKRMDAPSERRMDTPERRMDTPERRMDTPERMDAPPEKRIDTPEERIDTPEERMGFSSSPPPEKRIDTPKKRMDIPERRMDSPENIPPPTLVGQFKEEPKMVAQRPAADRSKVQPLLDKIDKLQKYGMGNSIMLDFIKRALEENKPVNKIELEYIHGQFANLTEILKSNNNSQSDGKENFGY